MRDEIVLSGVKTHNLKGIDARFPIGEMTVVTGVSGSGKSSLVFDTLYGEAYRRYVESLSSYARQYLKALPRPELESAQNLPPAVAVQQRKSGSGSRSTVGTMTELTDLFQVLFTHLSRVECPKCNRPVERSRPEDVARIALEDEPGHSVMIAAPLSSRSGIKPTALREQLEAQGFSRVIVRGEVTKLADLPAKKLLESSVVVDRVKAESKNDSRMVQAAELAFKLGQGSCLLIGSKSTVSFSTDLICQGCGVRYLEPSQALFSFNHPLGACQTCMGFGQESVLDWKKIIPNPEGTLATNGVAPWNFGQHERYYERARRSAAQVGITADQPFSAYTEVQWDWLRTGRGRFGGVLGYFAWLDTKKYKPHYRIHAARFHRYVRCTTCHGQRLNEKALACKIAGKSIADLMGTAASLLVEWLGSIDAGTSPNQNQGGNTLGAAEAVEEAQLRLGYLLKVGLGYLSLDRPARTLSGGETQRIHMARCLGSALTETLFCLDEPTCGLHPRDSKDLLSVIHELRDRGNTIVVVEHERTMIDGADQIIEIGPGAGHLGGSVTFSGPPGDRSSVALHQPSRTTVASQTFLELSGACMHNLVDVSARFQVGALNVVCGVSGSGKSSLVQHTLYPLLLEALGQEGNGSLADQLRAAKVGPRRELSKVHEVRLVDQGALGRSSRSNIATYLGVFDHIRALLAATPTAKKFGLKPGAFSFNTPGGRCDECQGLGSVIEDMSFLGEMAVTCPKCEGRRFTDQVLAVEYRGFSLTRLLALTVAEAREVFCDRPKVVQVFDLVIQMGLGYLTLGQSTSGFSGGEAQRLKLLNLMRVASGTKPSILIFDEPTSGLSDRDVETLIQHFHRLRQQGHTVIVVEHHVDLIRQADWVIEMGPEAAADGGRLVFQGPPSKIHEAAESRTAPFIPAT